MKPRTGAEVRAFIQNRAEQRPRSEIPVVQVDGTKATMRLFDAIDSWGEWYGMSAKEFAAAMDELPSQVTEVDLLINSPGGDAFDGIAIVNIMRAHPARTVAVVQGIAASAASFIAVAADETIMSPNSTLMIHRAWGLVVGNADDMLAQAELLELVDVQQADIYTSKSGRDVDEIRELMKAETFLSADEAVALGLADRIVGAADDKPDTSARWTDADIQALAAEFARLGIPTPSAGEREDTATDPTSEPELVDPEQASRLLATLTLTKENPHE